jgi:hypothetical protein
MAQTFIAAILVAIAAGWLARRFYVTVIAASRGQVDKCGSCGHNPRVKTPGIVQLGAPKSSHR